MKVLYRLSNLINKGEFRTDDEITDHRIKKFQERAREERERERLKEQRDKPLKELKQQLTTIFNSQPNVEPFKKEKLTNAALLHASRNNLLNARNLKNQIDKIVNLINSKDDYDIINSTGQLISVVKGLFSTVFSLSTANPYGVADAALDAGKSALGLVAAFFGMDNALPSFLQSEAVKYSRRYSKDKDSLLRQLELLRERADEKVQLSLGYVQKKMDEEIFNINNKQEQTFNHFLSNTDSVVAQKQLKDKYNELDNQRKSYLIQDYSLNNNTNISDESNTKDIISQTGDVLNR